MLAETVPPSAIDLPDCRAWHGDALRVLPALPTNAVDAVLCDPPYSSGGLFRGDRTMAVADKYQSTGTLKQYDDFSGDARDQRSWTWWCSAWLSECLRIVRPSGYCGVFCDWRQLPALSDALQGAGWTWRGIFVWDKTEAARAPHTGYWRHQCEFVVWGTKGVSRPATHGGPWPGCLRHRLPQSEKLHMVAKPLALMRDLVQIVPPGAVVLDPFAGSGTTLVAALAEGRKALGIECDAAHIETIRGRLSQTRLDFSVGDSDPPPAELSRLPFDADPDLTPASVVVPPTAAHAPKPVGPRLPVQ